MNEPNESCEGKRGLPHEKPSLRPSDYKAYVKIDEELERYSRVESLTCTEVDLAVMRYRCVDDSAMNSLVLLLISILALSFSSLQLAAATRST